MSHSGPAVNRRPRGQDSLDSSRGCAFELAPIPFTPADGRHPGLEEEIFGKRILFTDKTIEQASTAQIVAEYRSQEAVEGDFRQMKDPKVVLPA